MTIETGIENAGVYIDTLDDTYPAGGDDLAEGDNHIRGIKNCILNTFPNVAGAVTPTHTELNLLDGLTAGTVTASKPVVVDANKDASSFRNIGIEGNVLDTNGNESIRIVATGSAVNDISVANAATGNKPSINQTGADDVGIDIEGVELHNGNITGNVTGNADTATMFSSLRMMPHYIKLEDQKTSGTNGGSATAGSWQTRTLNTEVTDTGNYCTLSANQFTLAAGTYHIRALSQFHETGGVTVIRLQNITDATTAINGENGYGGGSADDGQAALEGEFTIAASKTFEIQYYCLFSVATYGLGKGSSSIPVAERFTTVHLWKVA